MTGTKQTARNGRTRNGTDTDVGCQHVDFSDDEPERCAADAQVVVVGGVTTRLCDDHAAQAREELVA